MGENVKKQKKSGSINAFVIVFLVIVGCYIMSLFLYSFSTLLLTFIFSV